MKARPFISLIISLFALLTVEGEIVRLRADHWMPFNGDPGSDRPGAIVEIARRVFAEHGITVEYTVAPWARAVKDCEEGLIEGVIGASKEDSEVLVYPEEPQGELRLALVVPQTSTFTYTGVESLAKVRLGCVLDYAYTDEIDAHIEANKGRTVNALGGDNPVAQALVLFQRNRLDVFIEDFRVFSEAAREAGMKPEAFKVAATIDTSPLYIAFSPKLPGSTRLASLLSAGTARLRASGELAKILARHGMEDWK